MHVDARDAVVVPPDDHRDLAMGLQTDQTVDDMHSRLLELLRPDDVVLLVEARLQLHKRRDLLAVLGGGDQCSHDRGVESCAVERLLDRQNLGVVGGSLDKIHNAREGVEGMMHQDILRADHREDTTLLLLE